MTASVLTCETEIMNRYCEGGWDVKEDDGKCLSSICIKQMRRMTVVKPEGWRR